VVESLDPEGLGVAMRALVIIAGVLAAVFGGAVGLFTVGEVAAVVIVLVVVSAVVYVLAAGMAFARWVAIALGIVSLAALAYGGYSAYAVIDALANTDGPVDPADPAALASGKAKLDDADGKAGFRIELSAAEITAVLQDALVDNSDNPLRRVDLTVVDGKDGGEGHIDFTGKFKNGGIEAKGSVGGKVDAGRITFDIRSVDLGNFKLPGLARGAMRDLIETVTDLNKKLEAHNADVQSVEIGGGKVIVTGVQGDGELVTVGSLLQGLKQNVANLGAKATPPAETIGQGTVDARELDGSRYYVALGDSLAANVGVASAKDGYVSRFLKAVDAKDGTKYGLHNFGVSGQTSSGLIRNGQLDDAVAFIKSHDVAYITIDIGANDLLGHLYSLDCSESVKAPACQDRVGPALTLYQSNLQTILKRLKDAAPKASIIMLGMYNPFSIGFGAAVGLEGETDAIVQQVNQGAAKTASEQKVTFADGEPAIRGRAGAVTHMLDNPPDIHPRPIGYDLLAAVLVAAVK
jgi:lysophospholipase L1-like esterase